MSETPADGGRLLVIGSINLDLVTRVESFPRPGETLLGSDYVSHHGGKGANQAVAATRMGASVAFVGSVGDDDFGRRLRAGLEDDGIDLGRLTTVKGASGVAFITLDNSSQNTIIVAPGANASVLPESLTPADFEGVDAVILQLEIPIATVSSALELATRAGVTAIVNAAPAGAITLEELRGCDVLIVNETEAASLLGEADADDPRRQLARLAEQVPTVVITLGADGVVWRDAAGDGSLAPHQVEVVDTTAAGDAFVGALAAGLARGLPLATAVAWGNAAGAVAVTREGAQPSLPRLAEVEALLG